MSRTHHSITENTESNQNEQQALLEIAESYLREFVAPVASEIEENPEVLKATLQEMGTRSLLALE